MANASYSSLPKEEDDDGDNASTDIESHNDKDTEEIDHDTVPSIETPDGIVDNEVMGLESDSPWHLKLKVLIKQAVPICISFFLGVGGGFFNLIYAGTFTYNNSHSTVFAAVSLANMFTNVTFLSLLVGLSSAIETIGSQNNGRKQYREVGLVLQRGMAVLWCLMVPIIVLWLNADKLFRLVGIEKDVCDVLEIYVRIRILTTPMDVVNVTYEKYLMSIGVVHPTMWDSIAFNILILAFNSLFVHHYKFGFECLAWTWVIATYISGLIQIVLSLQYDEVRRTLQRPSWEALNLSKIYEFISLGLPGTVMLCSEWWAFEILTLFASALGTSKLAAQSIIMQTASLCFMMPLGLGIATASLVGNALGAKKRSLAINIGDLSIATIIIVQIFIGFAIHYAGKYFVYSFTKDEAVAMVAIKALPFLAVFTWFDALQGVSSGILRGTGKQNIGAVANVIAFYAIGLPMAWVMSFRAGFDVNGLMMGISFGSGFQVIVLIYLIKCNSNYIFSTILKEDNSIDGADIKDGKDTLKAVHKSPQKDRKSLHGSGRINEILSPYVSDIEMMFKRVRNTKEESKFMTDDFDDIEEVVF